VNINILPFKQAHGVRVVILILILLSMVKQEIVEMEEVAVGLILYINIVIFVKEHIERLVVLPIVIVVH
jgi:hypothetical protein